MLDAKPLLKELKKREFRWPVLADALGSDVQWDPRKFDLLQTLAQIRTQYSKSVLLRLFVSADDKNSQEYILKVRLRNRPRRHTSHVPPRTVVTNVLPGELPSSSFPLQQDLTHLI